MVNNFEKEISDCKTNMIEWCYDISKAPTDGTEIIAWDNVGFLTCVATNDGGGAFTFVRSSYGEPIDKGCYSERIEFDRVIIRKWAYIPK